LIALRWSSEIEDELRNSALPALGRDSEQIDTIIQDLHNAVPDWQAIPGIGDYAKTSEIIQVPDRDDLAVLAAGLATDAAVILTKNLADFTKEMVQRTSIAILHPTDFLSLVVIEYPDYALTALQELSNLTNKNVADLLRNAGHSQTVIELLDNLLVPVARTYGTVTKRLLKPRCDKILPRAGVPCERQMGHNGKCRRYLKPMLVKRVPSSKLLSS